MCEWRFREPNGRRRVMAEKSTPERDRVIAALLRELPIPEASAGLEARLRLSYRERRVHARGPARWTARRWLAVAALLTAAMAWPIWKRVLPVPPAADRVVIKRVIFHAESRGRRVSLEMTLYRKPERKGTDAAKPLSIDHGPRGGGIALGVCSASGRRCRG